jgi:adenylate kinase
VADAADAGPHGPPADGPASSPASSQLPGPVLADGRPASSLKIVLLGPPGAGKGTQSEFLSRTLGIPAISTGELLRDGAKAGTELGRRVAAIMTAGALVDDATMAEVVRERLAQCAGGFLLDGYPRTLPQAEILDGILADRNGGRGGSGKDLSLDAVLLVEVPEEELVRRTLARGRDDDREDVVRARLDVYRNKTAPLAEYYAGRGLLRTIDGNRPIAEVTTQMLGALGALDIRSESRS